MKMVKSLILGSAAALVAVGGAQAADLPVKAKAVEYVKVCSLYGPGFYYIPGTDTCIKLSGYLRADVVVNSNSDYSGPFLGAGGANNRFSDGYTWRSREDFDIDTRTATEYGVVRTYFDAVFSWTNADYANTGTPGATVYSPIGTVSAPGNANAGGVAGGALGVYLAFIQFAGFTIGRAVSQFAAPWVNYPGNNFDGLVGGIGTVTGINQFSYTAQFGNGVSVTLSAQDPTTYLQAGVQNLGVLGATSAATGLLGPYGASDYANAVSPDFVGMLRVDQAWGLFQASVAAHDNHAAYYGGTELTGHPEDKWGWAGALALSIKNIPTGPGDTINVQGVYTNGATRYNINDLSFAGAPQVFSGTNAPGAYQSIGLGLAPDSVFVTGGSQQLVSTWGMRGAYVHNWSPNWNTSVYGAFAQVMYNNTAKGFICGPTGSGVGGTFGATFGTAGLTSCNPNYDIAQLGTQTQWTPVKNLTFSADLSWQHLDQKYAGTITLPAATGASFGKPAAIYELKNQDAVSLLLRAQRNW
ncbi:porin [Bradyrhizobium genosp. P]|uniref:porin n=1 Tax=Bradyrhizobium genosp. P TaxID=83641 RepID=UPI003CF32714